VGYLILTAAAILVPAGYAASCWLWPYGWCRLCTGSGKRARKDGRVFRDCWWCKGSGRRLRIGRRVWNRWAARRRAAR
jgi:hypothetical protein